jgi:glycosyltransferase involved in cell wall biosynthesis
MPTALIAQLQTPTGGTASHAAADASWLWIVLAVSLGISAIALVMTLWNLRVLGRAPSSGPIDDEGWTGSGPLVSLCIPARNEAANLEACVRGVLACEPALRAALGPRGGEAQVLEVLVYDDQSTDETPAILSRLVQEDSRVRAVRVEPLADGWNGKQHACWRMAYAAKGHWLGFTDADVRFEPATFASSLRQARATRSALISGFPRQQTGTLSEALVVPMIFFILFSYLPFVRMRGSSDASASAGCGQFLLVRRDAYDAAGGHNAFKNSMHDGIKLPRNVRRAGFHSDLVDATDLLSCRMYRGWGQTWRGFAKNAYEGLGSPGLLVFLTVMHVVGHVLPWVVLVWLGGVWLGEAWLGEGSGDWRAVAIAAGACGIQLIQRVVLAQRLRTSMLGAVLHPIGVVLMTCIQWHSYWLHLTGRRSWRGRVATTAGPAA